jgi:hypothetical protein
MGILRQLSNGTITQSIIIAGWAEKLGMARRIHSRIETPQRRHIHWAHTIRANTWALTKQVYSASTYEEAKLWLIADEV